MKGYIVARRRFSFPLLSLTVRKGLIPLRTAGGPRLKQKFQSELQDSRLARRGDLTEGIGAEGRVGLSLTEAIRDIERLGSKFQALTFAESEYSGQGRVKLPTLWYLKHAVFWS